jgi:hypothetical protein
MSRFFTKLRKRFTTDGGRPSTSRPFRPSVEALDSRIVPTVSYHGGAVLSHVDVRNVFYGQGWNTSDSWGILRYSLNKFQADITKSPYMAMLGEYGVGRGSFGGFDNVTGSSAAKGTTTVTETQLQSMLTTEILSGRLPWESGSQLYFVYLAPGLKDGWDVANTDAAHHGSFVMLPGTFLQRTVYYAVVPNYSSFASMTAYSSHELAEAVTDPDVRLTNTGWDYSHGAWYGKPAEIGDGLESQTVAFKANGTTYTVQKEWSNYFGKAIIANGNLAGWLDVSPATPFAFRTHAFNTWNNAGRTVSYYYATGWDGRFYDDFYTAAGDLAGTFTIDA